MEVVENLVKTTLGEMEKVLSTKTVVGEPISVNDNTLVPLVCIGFGFGVGGGSGKGEMKQKAEGSGGGSLGAAGIKPVALAIIDKDGHVTIEPMKGSLAAVLEKLAEVIPQAMEKCMDRWQERRKEG